MIFELVWVTLASATCWLAGYYLLRMWQIPNPLRVVSVFLGVLVDELRMWQRRRQSAREPSSGQAYWSFAYVRRNGVGVLLFHRDGEPRFVWEPEQNIRGPAPGELLDVSQCPEALRFCAWLNGCERYL